MRKPILFDMETSDPDDAMTLCLLAGHHNVNLVGVTVNPGSHHQIGIVREILRKFWRMSVPVGARDQNYSKECVSEFHYKWLGDIPPADADGDGHDIINRALQEHPDLTILTGGPLTNIKNLLANHEPTLHEIVVQGGFAGDSVVEPEHRLAKFVGRETCPTFNLNGDVVGAKALLAYPFVKDRYFVSKNVCHGITYDQAMHQRMIDLHSCYKTTAVIIEMMDVYLKKHSGGKMLHDPLAACVAIDRDVCEFKQVEIYREKGEWGSRLNSGTNTFISVAVDKERFFKVFTECTSYLEVR